jgi:UDP-N-acetylmuramate--alanine ligase
MTETELRVKRSDFLDKHVHLVGVGGAGMSALARLLHGMGARVSGSDDVSSPVLGDLRRIGIEVWNGPQPASIPARGGWVVRSAAVAADHPEVHACERNGFQSLLYSEALGRLSAEKITLAVAGSHGKTTTAAMTAAALRGGGVDASHVVGGDVPQLGGSGHEGSSPWLVVEACEFRRSFHRLRPRAAALLNFDHDHFDCYATREELLDAYAVFAAGVPPGGLVVLPADAPAAVVARVREGCAVRRVGWAQPADDYAVELRHDLGRYSFVPIVGGHALPRVHLRVPGLFQVGNGLCALVLASWVGVDVAGACRALSEFGGVRRRFELRTGPGGGELVNDYAHHPTELDAVLTAARQRFPGRRLLAVFQPHQHQRTRALLPEFAAALARADCSLIADIYGARETEQHKASVSAEMLAGAIRARGGDSRAVGGLATVVDAVRERYTSGSVVLMLGAGDIDMVVDDVVACL